MASKRRHLYCEEHLAESQREYLKYKDVTKRALSTLDRDELLLAARMRDEYSKRYVDHDSQAHMEFITLLRAIALDPSCKDERLHAFHKHFAPRIISARCTRPWTAEHLYRSSDGTV